MKLEKRKYVVKNKSERLDENEIKPSKKEIEQVYFSINLNGHQFNCNGTPCTSMPDIITKVKQNFVLICTT